MTRRRDSRGLTAGRVRPAQWAWLLAMLALLVQSLAPAAALAAQSRLGGEQVVICTGRGVQTITLPDDSRESPHKGFAGLPCQECLAAAVAALPAPAPQAGPVLYPTARTEHTPARSWTPQLARAPPRPPGQGPPQI